MVPDRTCLPTQPSPLRSIICHFCPAFLDSCYVLELRAVSLLALIVRCDKPTALPGGCLGSLRAVSQRLEPDHMEAACPSVSAWSSPRSLSELHTSAAGQMSEEASAFDLHTALWASSTLNNRHR